MSPFLPDGNTIDGVLRCGKYAFMPNFYAYCGPDKNKSLFEHCSQNFYEPDLNRILAEFEVMHPYLKLIAQNNNLQNEFAPETVEAYWLGNRYTENVNIKNLYRHFTEDKNLKSKLKQRVVEKVLGYIPDLAKPHHNFHVLNIWLRAGKLNIQHTLKSIDECRISWGRVEEIKKDSVIADYQPLVFAEDKLKFGQAIKREVLTGFEGQSFVKNLKIGDIITIHWGFACEKINAEQLKNLQKYTRESLEIFNKQAKEFLYG